MKSVNKLKLILILLYLWNFLFVITSANYQGYSSIGKGVLTIKNYDNLSKNSCNPSAISFEELTSFGTSKVINYKCPEGYNIEGIEYRTDSLNLYITGIRFICSDKTSYVNLGSEMFNSNTKNIYSGGNINEVAFGYDIKDPILRLIQVIKEEPLPKGSEILLSFISPQDHFYRTHLFLGNKPIGICAVIITNSKFVAPIIGNLRVNFTENRPLSLNPYNGFAYTGVPIINLNKPDKNECPLVSGVGFSSYKDLNFHIKCPINHRIIGINAILGDKITAITLESISNQLMKSRPNHSNLSTNEAKNDPFIDSLGSDNDNNSHETSENSHDKNSSVNNGEIIMLKFLCSDYITSFIIGQPLSNITSWNLMDQIPNLEDWEFSPLLIGTEIKKLIKEYAEKNLVLGTSDVRLGNINSLLMGYTTEKLLVKAFIKEKESTGKTVELSDYVERYTFGPVFIDVNEYIDYEFQTRSILKLLPEIYATNPINMRKAYSGDIFKGICGRIMNGSYLIGNFGFDTSKLIKPYFPQIYSTPNIKIENIKNGFKCEMLKPTEEYKQDLNDQKYENEKNVRSSLRSFQGSIRCPVGLSIESIQLLVNLELGRIVAMRFNCGKSFDNFFAIGLLEQFKDFIKNSSPTIDNKKFVIYSTIISENEISYDEILTISSSSSKTFSSTSVFIPESNLPISSFEVIQKSVNEREKSGLFFNSSKYPPNEANKKDWKNGILTEVCTDITAGGTIKNIGFYFKYPFQPTVSKSISNYYGYSVQGDGKIDVDTKEFTCNEMLHSPRSQLLFSKHVNDIIFTGKLQNKSKKTLLRAINYTCPGNSIINRVEVSWQVSRGLKSLNPDELIGTKNSLGSIGALRFFCSDGKSMFKVGADASPTHSQRNIEVHEIFLGYKALSNEEIARVKKEITQEHSVKLTEDILRSIPGDPVSFKLVHESFPLSKISLDVSSIKQYSSASDALISLKTREKTQNLKSKIWKGGRWRGVCIGLLNLSGGLLMSHEFSITSFGAYFEKPTPFSKSPYKGYVQTGVPQIHQNKIVSTCDLTDAPAFAYNYPGFSAAFLCPNGAHIERIGYSTIEDKNDNGFEILKNGTLTLPQPFKEQKHVGPLGQITSLQIICSDGISTITIGQPSKSVAFSKPGDISTIRIGYVKHNSDLIKKSTSHSTLLSPASIEILSSNKQEKLLKYSNPNFPEYTQNIATWKGENLKAICVDFAIFDDQKNKSASNYLRWTGNSIKIPEKYVIMSIGFAFQKTIENRGSNRSTKAIKVSQKVPKIRLPKKNIQKSKISTKK